MDNKKTIAIIGLGYVGLPLAVEFGKHRKTLGFDINVKRVGQWLRKYKLDELPQLLDVWLGDMSLVGPRPEVPRYVACYPADIRNVVLSVRPGITDRASIDFKDENEILGRANDPHLAYVNEVLPIKLSYYLQYVKTRSMLGDIELIFKTIRAIVLRGK
jgi:lipopolysaccharide/colanic/teichoic acid biosynthesis glycosyltransferase